MTSRREDDDLSFLAEDSPVAVHGVPWKLLIADDEEEVHRVTKLALAGFTLDERPIQFIDAYTGRDAIAALVEHPDTALVLMDVVMETDSAGLDAVQAIRTKLRNRMVRIVLRTGQPGQAPEHEVVTRYDINDYKEKTELTAKKLFTLTYTGLSLYRDLVAARSTRESLERIVDASSTVLRRRIPERLGQGALQLLASLLGVDRVAVPAQFGALMVMNLKAQRPEILAAAGRFSELAGKQLNVAGTEAASRLRRLREAEVWTLDARHFTARVPGADADQPDLGLYLESDRDLLRLDEHVLDVYCRNVALALRAAQARQELNKTQSHLIVTLSEAIERRSKETGNHVRRVGEYSRLLALLHGLKEDEADTLLIAAALHDAGKVAIPDAILNKPGKLTPEERVVMETHADTGAQMFMGQDLPVLHAAMIIAAQHHERWDGMGYPRKLKGEEIHLYGRIAALADVFDALGSHRCYKKAWPLEDVLATLRAERGHHFEPVLIDLFMGNLDQFLAIRDRLADPPPAVPYAGP